MQEYAVIVKNFEQLDSLYRDMENNGCGVHDCCPDRVVDCSIRKPYSRVTYYRLTEEEVDVLKRDHRIESIELSFKEQNIVIKPNHRQTGVFSKVPSANNHKNWALLYASDNGTDVPYWGPLGWAYAHNNIQATIDFDTNALGEGVDIVIVDGGVDFDHPEFAVNDDGTGGSRFVQYDWFQHDQAVKGSPQTVSYNYNSNAEKSHGTHVAGIAAGNTQGWARKANIYNINIFDNQISGYMIFDYIKAFHNSKNGSRPTIVNCSFGYEAPEYIRVMSEGPDHMPGLITTIPFDKNNPYIPQEITNIHYQGTNYNERFVYGGIEPRCEPSEYADGLPVEIFWNTGYEYCCEVDTPTCYPRGGGYCPCQTEREIFNDTICGQDVGFEPCPPGGGWCFWRIYENGTLDGINYYYVRDVLPVALSQIDVDVADCVSAGVVVVAAAGNEGRYIANSDDINYNNRIDTHQGLSFYYMRRASPATNASLVVGALGTERKEDLAPGARPGRYPSPQNHIARFSNKGTGVDIWAPGEAIISSDFGPQNTASTFPDPRNNNFTIGVKSGTSMASPQIAGLIACAMSIDSTVNSSNVKTYLLNNGRQNEIYSGWRSKPKPIGAGPTFSNVQSTLSPNSVSSKNSYSLTYGPLITNTTPHVNTINHIFKYGGKQSFSLSSLNNTNKVRKIYKFTGNNNSNIARWTPNSPFSQFNQLLPNEIYWIESISTNFAEYWLGDVYSVSITNDTLITNINQIIAYSCSDTFYLSDLNTSIRAKIRNIYTFTGTNGSNLSRYTPGSLFNQFDSLTPGKIYFIESISEGFSQYELLPNPCV